MAHLLEYTGLLLDDRAFFPLCFSVSAINSSKRAIYSSKKAIYLSYILAKEPHISSHCAVRCPFEIKSKALLLGYMALLLEYMALLLEYTGLLLEDRALFPLCCSVSI